MRTLPAAGTHLGQTLAAQARKDEQALFAAQRFELALARLGLGGQVALVLGQQALLGDREVQVEDHQVGQGVASPFTFWTAGGLTWRF